MDLGHLPPPNRFKLNTPCIAPFKKKLSPKQFALEAKRKKFREANGWPKTKKIYPDTMGIDPEDPNKLIDFRTYRYRLWKRVKKLSSSEKNDNIDPQTGIIQGNRTNILQRNEINESVVGARKIHFREINKWAPTTEITNQTKGRDPENPDNIIQFGTYNKRLRIRTDNIKYGHYPTGPNNEILTVDKDTGILYPY